LMKWIRQNRFDNQLFFCFEVFWRRLIQNCYFLLFSLSSLMYNTTQKNKLPLPYSRNSSFSLGSFFGVRDLF
jgi:hypothetical protein